MDFVEQVNELLEFGDTKTLKALINDEKFEINLLERGSDVIMCASYYIRKQTLDENKKVFRYAEKILCKCAELGKPNECFLEYLGQIECLDEIKVTYLLKPIQTVLLRIPEGKKSLMQSVFYVLYNFINALPLPEYHHLDDNSKLLLDCDDQTVKIKELYQLIVEFYEPLVREVEVKCADNRSKGLRVLIIQGLLHLLGTPLVHFDLEHNEKGQSKFRTLAVTIVKYISRLKSDLLYYLTLVEDKEVITVKKEKSIIREGDVYGKIKHSDLSLASLFYLVLVENMQTSFPCVYNELFLIQNCLSLAVTLLRYKERMVLRKGLLLAQVTIYKAKPSTLNFIIPVHKDIVELLSKISTFHSVLEDRKLAIEILNLFIFIFKPKAQYDMFLNISNNTDIHPNVIGYLVLVLKKLIQNALINNAFKQYFTGKRLIDLLKMFCSLEKGAETDIIEKKEPILSSLSLIIFLAKDKENLTGFRDYARSLSNSFLCPLREGLKLSRAHFKLELNKLDNPIEENSATEIMVNVDEGEMVKSLNEGKKKVLYKGLISFNLIEHQLIWANDSIEEMINKQS